LNGEPLDGFGGNFTNPSTIGFMRIPHFLAQLAIALMLNHLIVACSGLLADADARPIQVEGGGDLVSASELERLRYIASGNSSAAMHNFLGLPTCSAGSTEYYPVLTTGDPAWVAVSYSGFAYSSWTFVVQDPCGS
jgi:hypothetical protein